MGLAAGTAAAATGTSPGPLTAAAAARRSGPVAIILAAASGAAAQDTAAVTAAATEPAAGPDAVAEAAPAAPVGPEPSIADQALDLSERISANLGRIAGDVLDAGETLPGAVVAAAPAAPAGWPWLVLVLAAGAILIGLAIEHVVRRRLVAWDALALPGPGASRRERIAKLLLGLVAEAVLIVIAFGIGYVLARTAFRAMAGQASGLPAAAAMASAITEAYIILRLVLLGAGRLLSPRSEAERIVPVPTPDASAIMRTLTWGLGVGAVLAAVGGWLAVLPAAPGITSLAQILTSVVIAGTLIRAILIAKPGTSAFLAERPSRSARLLRHWPGILIAYLVIAVAATVVGRLAGLPISGLVAAPLYAVGLAAVLYAVGLIVVDTFLPVSQRDIDEGLPSYRRWGEETALLLAIAASLMMVIASWGIPVLNEQGSVRAVWVLLGLLIVVQSGRTALNIAFERKLTEEAGPMQLDEQDEGEGGGRGRSRLATILPLIRSVIMVTLLVMVVMMALSALGVNIAPLFAGAGILGLAIGFGSQALVRDVVSGFFFLLDDAFRIGEYIETGSAKGTVERISVRSMQLRHQNGPLHTIPFGDIGQVTNYSRDWVIMKMPIKVWHGTDTEKVRKIIKKLGIELQNHPEIGPKFIEPLKSQGVYSIEDNGIVIRMKYKCRPGDQFSIRKVIYQRIDEIFAREGIRFGGRDVLVNLEQAALGSTPAPATPAAPAAPAASAPPAAPPAPPAAMPVQPAAASPPA
jgi:hypothetical protein